MSMVDSGNKGFQTALAFINQTDRHIFLTGKAGTGKTTFLRYLKENGYKKMAVVAPTGVAAINAGGVTIHSFFQIPPGTFVPSLNFYSNSTHRVITRENLLKHLRLNSNKKELIRELDLLVIDEVSMVRADLLDAVDAVLRYVRHQPLVPFGGLQVLYIGDLFQLPPVAKHEEWKLLRNHYAGPFFFDAQVIQEVPPLYIELTKVYRQSDDAFIEILNNIRNNCCERQELDLLHQYYQPDFRPAASEHFITLTTHNGKADHINREELEILPGSVHEYSAGIAGEFPENSYPAEVVLHLKAGAQIMFIKNDKGEVRRYFNGKIGRIHSIDREKIWVSFPGEPELLELQKETWINIRYTYNKTKDRIDEEELGSFTQYPIRLAWAITIHKSQGLTFEKAIVDAGASFAAGQVYVALSRLTSLNGLVLHSRIYSDCIQTDERVIAFAQQQLPSESLQENLVAAKQEFIACSLVKSFNWEKLSLAVRQHLGSVDFRIINDAANMQLAETLLKGLDVISTVSQKFRKQLTFLVANAVDDQYEQLNDRINAAAAYFIKELDQKLMVPLNEEINRRKTKKYSNQLQEIKRQLERRKQQLENIIKVVASMRNAQTPDDVQTAMEELHKPIIVQPAPEIAPVKMKLEKGMSKRTTLQMFKEGRSIEDIALSRGLSSSTIEGHLAEFIPTGEVDILDLVEEVKLQKILNTLESGPEFTASLLKEQLGEDFSYGEIKAAMKFQEKKLSGENF